MEAFDENEDLEKNKVTPLPPKNTLEGHHDTPTQEAPYDDNKSKEDDDQKSESSISDTGSSDENIADLISLWEL